MDTRLSSTTSLPPIAVTRADPAPVRNAVQTDLAPPIAISAQVGSEKTRWAKDPRKQEQSPGNKRQNESSIETDRETGDLVYKIIDPTTRATVSQYPYESLLKLRAYIKSTDQSGDE
jgi:hypothetical protein